MDFISKVRVSQSVSGHFSLSRVTVVKGHVLS